MDKTKWYVYYVYNNANGCRLAGLVECNSVLQAVREIAEIKREHPEHHLIKLLYGIEVQEHYATVNG